MSIRHVFAAVAGIALGPTACLLPGNFECTRDEQCVLDGAAGRCIVGYCAFEDMDCESGYRFHQRAPAELRNRCTDDRGDGGSSSTGANGSPEAVDDDGQTFESVPVTIAVLANDSDPDGDPLTIAQVTEAAGGTVEHDGNSVTYVPNEGFRGSDTFAYTASDGRGGMALANVTVTVSGQCDTWNASWTHRAQLTFQNTGATSTEDLVGFPVAVFLTPQRLDGSNVAASGDDLRFVDADNATQLPHEVEHWDPGGTSVVWVRVPQIDRDSDQDFIWLYAGNPDADPDPRPNELWSEYLGVWHMADEPSAAELGLRDSSPAQHHAIWTDPTALPVRGDGAVGPGLDVGTDEAQVPDDPSLDLTDAITVEAWVRHDEINSDSGRYPLRKNNNYWIQTLREFRDRPGFWARVPGDWLNADSPDIMTTDWTYLAGTYGSDDATARLYRNGLLDATQASSPGTPMSTSDSVLQVSLRIQGSIDEVRLAGTTRSEAWILAQHRSMTDQLVAYGAPNAVCP